MRLSGSCGLRTNGRHAHRERVRGARSYASRVLVVVALGLLPSAPPGAAAAPAWRQRYLAALTLCRGSQAPACRDSLLTMLHIPPGHPGVVYALARVQARLGDHAGAFAALDRYAAMGLTANIAADTALAALRADTAWAGVAARLEANRRPRSRARLDHRLSRRDLLAEDLAHDARSGRWFVSGVHGRAIVAIDRNGRESEFAPRQGTRPWGVFALGVDAARRLLWAGTAATPEMEGGAGADRGRSALLCYDLDRGTLLRRLELGSRVYVTDSVGGGVYVARPAADSLETLLAPGSLVSPQTPVLASHGARLIIPDYSRGLASLDLASGALSWLGQPDDLAAAGTDGLYAWRGGLVAIQNGVTPHRVLRLWLAPDGGRVIRWRALEQASPELGEPNHGVVDGDDLVLIGNSGWDRVGDDGTMAESGDARPPVLLRLPLTSAPK